jgi:hypothetical protein
MSENQGVDPRHQHNISQPQFSQAQPDRDILMSAQLIMSGINTLALVPEKFLRDYFAGQFIAGVLANPTRQGVQAGPEALATVAYEMADAMLAAREKKA